MAQTRNLQDKPREFALPERQRAVRLGGLLLPQRLQNLSTPKVHSAVGRWVVVVQLSCHARLLDACDHLLPTVNLSDGDKWGFSKGG